MKECTLLQQDFHVSPSASRGSEEARTMTAISGRRLLPLLKHTGPLGSLVKTCLESSIWHSTRCYLIWKALVTPSNRLLFQLALSEPIISDDEYGLLPTPLARDSKGITQRGMWPNARRQSLANLVGGCPHPDDVEKMMGLPTGHTALNSLETPSSRKSPTKSLKPSES